MTAFTTNTLFDAIQTKRILLVMGAGGVGKTTVSAMLGIRAALASRRTLVCTIDPAKRLASALGLHTLSDTPQAISFLPSEKTPDVATSPLKPGKQGELFAMMLDVAQTFDALLKRYSPNPKALERVLKNPIYRQISTRLAGSQEYAAMEKLYELWEAQEFDLLILDTPPSVNAIDFLEAPNKMVDAVDSPAVEMLVRIYKHAGQLKLDWLGFGAAYVLRRLIRFTGKGFLDDIARFLTDLGELLHGLKARAKKVEALLEKPEVGVLIVTAPRKASIQEAQELQKRLDGMGIVPLGIIFNKCHTAPAKLWTNTEIEAALRQGAHPDIMESDLLTHLLSDTQHLQNEIAKREAEAIAQFRLNMGGSCSSGFLPLLEEDVHDLAGLVGLSRVLREQH